MRGFKVLNHDLSNRYGFVYEIGKKYILNGNLKWKENGFHFCLRPEDTLRFVDGFNEEVCFAIVEGEGELILHEDEYYGFYDMYTSSEMTIIDIISREDIFNLLINSENEYRIQRYASLIKLTNYEKEEILKRYPRLKFTIDYYQNDEFILKKKLGII